MNEVSQASGVLLVGHTGILVGFDPTFKFHTILSKCPFRD